REHAEGGGGAVGEQRLGRGRASRGLLRPELSADARRALGRVGVDAGAERRSGRARPSLRRRRRSPGRRLDGRRLREVGRPGGTDRRALNGSAWKLKHRSHRILADVDVISAPSVWGAGEDVEHWDGQAWTVGPT